MYVHLRVHPGTPWPAKNDGRVVVRALLRGGLRPDSDDQRVLSYAAQWGGSSKGLRLGVRVWGRVYSYPYPYPYP